LYTNRRHESGACQWPWHCHVSVCQHRMCFRRKQKVTEHIGVTPERGIVSARTLSPAEVHSVCYKSSEFCQFCNTERLCGCGQYLWCRTFLTGVVSTVGCDGQPV